MVKEPENIELYPFLHALGPELSRILGPSVSLFIERPNDRFVIRHIPESLQDLFKDLTRFARQRMPEGGSYSIKMESGNGVIPHEKVPRRVRIIVSDTGRKLTDDEIKVVFEPDFSREPASLVMSRAYGLVVCIQGNIKVHTDGPGNTFVIYFPIA